MSAENDDEELRRILQKKKEELLAKLSSQSAEGDSSGGNGGQEPRVAELNDSSFDEFIASHKAVVVDFWAPWCAPCFLVSPIIDDLALQHKRIAFARVNADASPETASKYYVMSLPTIMFFLDGQEVDRVVGAVPEEVLEERVQWLESKL
ncbi:thioredoxin [Acidilobus sp.]|jgi:thioredoxin 1|uniref:thioredoxin n=1 Tax=Acidilobus sp. TaxID=1872109 RepID=UPI003CFC93B1